MSSVWKNMFYFLFTYFFKLREDGLLEGKEKGGEIETIATLDEQGAFKNEILKNMF